METENIDGKCFSTKKQFLKHDGNLLFDLNH